MRYCIDTPFIIYRRYSTILGVSPFTCFDLSIVIHSYGPWIPHRISVALAHTTHISIQEAVCMAQGRIPKKMYRGVYKYASVVGVF